MDNSALEYFNNIAFTLLQLQIFMLLNEYSWKHFPIKKLCDNFQLNEDLYLSNVVA